MAISNKLKNFFADTFGKKNNKIKTSETKPVSDMDAKTEMIEAVTKDNSEKNKDKAPVKKKKKVKKPLHPAVSLTINILQCLLYIGCVIGVSAFLGINIVRFANDMFAFQKEEVEYTITLKEGATVNEIATELEENGIIGYGKVFELYCKLRKDNGVFLEGDIELNSKMDYDAIRRKLKVAQKETKVIRLVIPEGYTVDQIIDLLTENGIGKRERYVEVINGYDFEFDFLPAIEAISDDRNYRLEGYLFPDTYDFATNEKEETVIYKFLSNFERKFEKEYYEKANALGLTVDEVLTLASMIEREVRIATDYELVSSVFHNRLNSNSLKKLESDATINYFLEEHTKDLTAEHLMIDNPYNTYMYEGLPPGPICNPGVEAIAYAFYPVTTNYYFFVSQDDGTTLYAETKAEHEKNKETARLANEAYNKQGK